MTQTAYIDKIKKKFHMDGCHPTYIVTRRDKKPIGSDCPTEISEINEMKQIPYRSAVGSLLYLAMATRLDICEIVCLLARFGHNPSSKHWDVVKDVIRYVVTTSEEGLTYMKPDIAKNELINVSGYSDESFNDCPTTAKSTVGYLTFFFHHCVTWRSKLSSVVAQSAMEAEMIALSMLSKEVRWLRLVLEQLFRREYKKIPLYCDNDPAIQTYKGGYRVTDATKHIRPKFYFIVEMMAKHEVEIFGIETGKQLADILTKILGNPQFATLRKLCGIC